MQFTKFRKFFFENHFNNEFNILKLIEFFIKKKKNYYEFKN